MPEPSEPNTQLALPAQQTVLRLLENLVTSVPSSTEALSTIPHERANEILRVAGLKAGALSAGLAIAPGPAGMLTVIPDLIQVWNIQRQMVSDIAACYLSSCGIRLPGFKLARSGYCQNTP
jgi:hypothetical protein